MKKETIEPNVIKVTFGEPGQFPVALTDAQFDTYHGALHVHHTHIERQIERSSKFIRVLGVIGILGVLALCAWDVFNRRKQGLQLVTLTK